MTLFETFWAQFQNCARHNRWDRSIELVYLRNSLNKDVANVLWDHGKEVIKSPSGLTNIENALRRKKLLPSSIVLKYETDKNKMMKLCRVCIRTHID